MTINSELEKILLAKRKNPYSESKSIQELREEHRNNALAILPIGTKLNKVNIESVPAEWVKCNKISSKYVFMFIHGGGYYRGSAEASRALAARISSASHVTCLSIDYRLAPENTYPAALEDTYSVYMWLLKNGFASENIIVGGVSAGGGLTLALLLKLKELDNPIPAAAVTMSPWTDMTQSGLSMKTNANLDPVISKSYLDRMATLYLKETNPITPFASPLFGNLEGLPPILIQVGSAETMLEDSRRFAEKAKKAKVEVSLEIWDDMFHGWHGYAHVLKEANLAINNIGKFVKKIIKL